MVHVDPEYFHLFNGLNLAIFNLAIDFIHHPGTTIQMVFAISAPIVNLLQPGHGLIANAINDPESFIHGANILLNLITAGSVFLLGWYSYKYTGNILLALLLQMMPFASYKILMISGRLIPETGLIAPLLILCLLIVRYLYDTKRENHSKFYLLGFAIVGGLGMAGKFLYLPFTIIPLILFTKSKLRGKYILYTAISTIVFAFPVFVHFGKSFKWFGNMFLHSGKWGTGDQMIYDPDSGWVALAKLYNIDKSFFVILGLTGILLIISYFLTRVNKSIRIQVRLRAIFAVVVAVMLSILMITKHFSAHYFIPTLIFKLFLVYLMAELFIIVIKPKKIRMAISVVALFIGLIIFAQQFNPLAIQHNYFKQKAERLEERRQVLQQYNTIDNPLIITSHYRGSPFVESAMVAGVLMSGSLKSTYIEQLAGLYPNTYFYYDWSDEFYFWDEFLKTSQFIDTQTPVYIFIGEGMEAGLEVILERLKKAFPDHKLDINLLHHFTDPEEYFYEVILVEKPLL